MNPLAEEFDPTQRMLSLLDSSQSDGSGEPVHKVLKDSITNQVAEIDKEYEKQNARASLHAEPFQQPRRNMPILPLPEAACATSSRSEIAKTQTPTYLNPQSDLRKLQLLIPRAYAELGVKHLSLVCQLQRAQKGIDHFKCVAFDSEREKADLMADNAGLRMEYMALQRAVLDLQAELLDSRTQILHLKQRVERDQQDLKRHEKVIKSYEATVSDLEAECADWKAQVQAHWDTKDAQMANNIQALALSEPEHQNSSHHLESPVKGSADFSSDIDDADLELEDVTDLSLTMGWSSEDPSNSPLTLDSCQILPIKVYDHSAGTASTKTALDKETIVLKKQLDMYKNLSDVLIQERQSWKPDPYVVNVLLRSGLHKQAPMKQYVSESFFASARNDYVDVKRTLARKPLPAPNHPNFDGKPASPSSIHAPTRSTEYVARRDSILGPALEPATSNKSPLESPTTPWGESKSQGNSRSDGGTEGRLTPVQFSSADQWTSVIGDLAFETNVW